MISSLRSLFTDWSECRAVSDSVVYYSSTGKLYRWKNSIATSLTGLNISYDSPSSESDITIGRRRKKQGKKRREEDAPAERRGEAWIAGLNFACFRPGRLVRTEQCDSKSSSWYAGREKIQRVSDWQGIYVREAKLQNRAKSFVRNTIAWGVTGIYGKYILCSEVYAEHDDVTVRPFLISSRLDSSGLVSYKRLCYHNDVVAAFYACGDYCPKCGD